MEVSNEKTLMIHKAKKGKIQEVLVNVDVLLTLPANTEREAFKLIDSLSLKEILLLALAQLPFDLEILAPSNKTRH